MASGIDDSASTAGWYESMGWWEHVPDFTDEEIKEGETIWIGSALMQACLFEM